MQNSYQKDSRPNSFRRGRLGMFLATLLIFGALFFGSASLPSGVALAQGPDLDSPTPTPTPGLEQPLYSKPDRPVKEATEEERRAQAAANANISFTSTLLQGETSQVPTSLQFGPDGKLYVADVYGVIQVYTIVRYGPNDYQVTNTETIGLILEIPNHNDDGSPNPSVGSRQVTGLFVAGTPTDPILYVTSSDPRIGAGPSGNDKNLDTNSGVLSRITQTTSGTWAGAVKLDLVRGLPRSEENHSPNGMAISADGNTLYVAMGGNANMGAPSNNFAYLPEFALSAAILSVDLQAIGETTYDLPTLDDPTRGDVGQPAENDPFGGNNGLNQAKLVAGGPVQVYASGFRNPYDVFIASDGRMYSIDNGPNAGWGDIPINEGPSGNCTNDPNNQGQTQQDNLHYISAPGYYAGHPNPTRGNPQGIFGNESDSPVPFAMANPIECDHFDVGSDGSLAQWPYSTNGFVEYTASNFEGEMQGDLLATGWSSQQIFRVKLSYDQNDNPTVLVDTTLFNSVGDNPLDITAQGDNDIFPGTIWVASLYGGGPIKIYEPAGFTGCGGGYNPVLDEDGDGYDNADEIDNGTDACSPADTPPDNDEDFTSDLNDPDDDNDGTPDVNDPFAIDADNGATTLLPAINTWDNDGGEKGGILGLGFTGLMSNGTDDYLTLFDTGNMTAGGAGGLATIDNVPAGDALGSTNTQEYAFQYGVATGATSLPFTAHTGVLTPFAGITPEDNQSSGLFIGTGSQDNYLKMVVAANGGVGGIQLVKEEDGVVAVDITYGPSEGVSLLGVNEVDLYLKIDPATNTVQPSVAIDGGTRTALGSAIPIPASWIAGPNAMAVGLISTSSGPGPEFIATWDEIGVDYETTDLNGAWQSLTPSNSPTARHENGFVQYDGKFYLLGGRGNKPVQIYDPSSNSWSNGANPPIEMHHFQAVVYDEKIAVVAGYTGNCCSGESGLTHIYFYDPVLDTWSQGAEIPVARRRGSTGVVLYNDKIYILGGLDGGHSGSATSYAWFDEYDPATDSWTQLADAPRVRDHFQALVIEDKLYAIGGRDSSQSLFNHTIDEVDVYDFATDTWSTLPASSNIPTPRAGAATGVLGNEILIIGGESGAQTDAHSEVEAFDIRTNSWRTLPSLNEERHGTQVALCNEGLYIAAGSGDRGGSPELNSMERFFLNGERSCIPDSEVINGLSISSNSPVVIGNASEFTATVSSGNNISYEWDFGDGSPLVISNATISHTYATTGTFSVVVTATNSVSSDSDSLTVSIIEEPLPDTIGINSGGAEVIGSEGTWEADHSFTGGGTFSKNTSISGTDDPALYQSERNTNFSYDIAVPANACYNIRLHFAEIWFGAEGGGSGGVGSRVFDVSIENQQVLDNYDIFGAAGGAQIAVIEEIFTEVEDGEVNIEFTSVVNSAKVSAIEVVPTGFTTCLPQPITGLEVNAPTSVVVDFPAEFNATVTGGNGISYEWDFGDGSPTVFGGATISHTYSVINSYTVNVTATNTINVESASTNIDVVDAPPANAIYVNAGGPTVTTNNVTYITDSSYTTDGGTYTNNNPIADTTDDVLYQTERYGNVSYNFSQIGNGCYNVKLHFAEIWFDAVGGGTGGVGSRIFDVKLEGQPVLNNYDIHEQAGGAQIAQIEQVLTQVDDNELNLQLIPVVNNAKISAIELLPTGDATCPDTAINGLEVSSTSPTVIGNATQFDASVSSGNNITYTWSFGDGSPTITNGASISHSYPAIGTYTMVVTATNSINSESISDTVEIVDVPPPAALRINSGGPEVTTSAITWEADNSFTGGGTFARTIPISDTTNDVLYQTERTGNFSYNMTVANGCYTTKLHFVEIYWGAQSGGSGGIGKRVFDVTLEGELVLENYDIYQEAGAAQIALIEQFDSQVNDGELNINFTTVVDNAKVSAIEVIPNGSTCPETAISGLEVSGSTPVIQGDATQLTATVSSGNNITYTWNLGDGSPTITGSNTISHTYATTGTYTVIVTATNTINSQSANTIIEVVEVAPPATIYINSGGPEATTSAITWEADNSFTGGGTFARSIPISDTIDDVLYQTERTGNFNYNLTVANGCYTTKLHFAEIYWGAQSGGPGGIGKRVFDVTLEGQLVLDNYDIYQQAGAAQIALIEQFDSQVDDGELNIDFITVVNNAKVSAIEVIPNGATCPASLQQTSDFTLYLPLTQR